jgi:hypothetical protein
MQPPHKLFIFSPKNKPCSSNTDIFDQTEDYYEATWILLPQISNLVSHSLFFQEIGSFGIIWFNTTNIMRRAGQ